MKKSPIYLCLLIFATFTFVCQAAFASGKMEAIDSETWYEMQVRESLGLNRAGAQQPAQSQKVMIEPVESVPAPEPVATTTQVETVADVGKGRQSRYLVGLQGGFFDHPNVTNSTSINPAEGIKLGWLSTTGFVLGFDFVHSFQKTEINRLTQIDIEHVDHYMLSFGAGYNWIHLTFPQWSRIRLQTDVVGTQSWRQYNQDENSSQAFDLGGRLVASYDVTRSIQLGLEYRYMQNQSFSVDLSETSQDRRIQNALNGGNSSSLETFDYQIAMLSASYLF